jgi:hypothetical protein
MKVKVLNSLTRKFSKEMNICLSKPLILDELHSNVKSMANGKSLIPNGVVIECYIRFWDLKGEDCCRMVQIIIKEEHLLRGMNKGLMALLHIGVEKKNFGNWWSIFLLNVFHKILAKAL